MKIKKLFFYLTILSFFSAIELRASFQCNDDFIVMPEKNTFQKQLDTILNKIKNKPVTISDDCKIGILTTYLAQFYLIDRNFSKALSISRIGLKYINMALKSDPNNESLLYWKIMLLTITPITSGPLKAINTIKEIKLLIEQQLKADPESKFRDGAWLRVYGRLYLLAPPFPLGYGDPYKGINYIKRSIKLYPNNIINNFLLAIGYALTGDKIKAREEAKKVSYFLSVNNKYKYHSFLKKANENLLMLLNSKGKIIRNKTIVQKVISYMLFF